MPIYDEIRSAALAYIEAHLIDESSIRTGFSFIQDERLIDLIVLELKSARYIFRVMEMLDLRDTFSHPFCKFQIIQYAGVIEAAVDHLLFDRTYTNPKLAEKVDQARDRLQKSETLKTVSGLASKTSITFDGKDVFLAILASKNKQRVNINFDDRLKECLDLSFIDQRLSTELSGFYKQRHSVHLSAKLKHSISIELGDTKRAFRRINALCENVKRGFQKHQEP
jgi:hypothetical protein